jgi:hypothetical protein
MDPASSQKQLPPKPTTRPMEEQAGKDEPGAKLSEPRVIFIGGYFHFVNAAAERHPKETND